MKIKNPYFGIISICLFFSILVGCQKQQEPTISSRVIQIIATQLIRDPNSIELETSLMSQSLGADELDVVEIIMRLEDEFQIEIPDDQFVESNTKASVWVPISLNTQKLIDIVEATLKTKKNR